jgi:rhamnosyltransferase
MIVKRLGIYAHYDDSGAIKPFVSHSLHALRECCSRLILVSTSAIELEDRGWLNNVCDQVLLRENEGFDFASWSHILSREDLASWDEILLMNSSVIGPIHPLPPIMEGMASSPCDFWGMTVSYEITPHLQSYFFVFKRQTVSSPFFRTFWLGVLPFLEKAQVIRSYELGLTQYLAQCGLRPGAVVSPDLMPDRIRDIYRTRNPTLYWPLELLDRGMPFVKREVFRANPGGVALPSLQEAICRAGYTVPLSGL